MVKSSDDVPPCPICGGILKYRDSRKRICKREGGAKDHLLIRRFVCCSCKAHHNELPDCLVPHKHYEAEVISGVIDGFVTESDLDSEDYPCHETMKRWKFWFHKNVPNIEGMIRRVCGKLFLQAALLSSIREMSVNWLETVVRIIYNSGGKLFSTGWAYAPDL